MARAEALGRRRSPAESTSPRGIWTRIASCSSASRWTEQVAPTPRPNVALRRGVEGVQRWIGRSAGRRPISTSSISRPARARSSKDRVDDGYAQVSPTGKYVLFLRDDHYWTIDLASRSDRRTSRKPSRRHSSIANRTPPSSRSRRSASPAGRKTTPRCCCNDKFDLWQVPADGSRATRLTERRRRSGAASLRPPEPGRRVHRSRPAAVS